MGKKILISAGGTGGHLYPAQALAQELHTLDKDHEVLFVAGGLGSSRCFDRSIFSYQEVSCSPLISRNLFKIVKGGASLMRGFFQSVQIMKRYKPDVVVGFGSYYAAPTLLAAKWLKVPIVLHEANAMPGKANRWFAPYVDAIGVHFPGTFSAMGNKVVDVGMPLRSGYKKSSSLSEEAMAYFRLNPGLFTLLVFGGSQGSKSINEAIEGCFKTPCKKPLQLIHLTGNEQSAQELIQFYKKASIRATVKAFESRMDLAWCAADLFIGRSGASTLAEAIEFEVPGILIPYPYAADNHQEINADFFVDVVKGGIKCVEAQLTPLFLNSLLNDFLEMDLSKQMRGAINLHKRNSSIKSLSQLVLQTAKT
jgi:UDP-N-acetylglucosamine--N-acetylmuramyl-(pentapeptide) pyrophosphoryl-undecaprenol N-acetylglucosamine transferase